MNNFINRLSKLFNEKLALFLSISFGIFLFILFFKPFPVEKFDLDNMLIFVSGFGGIIFFFMFLMQTIIPSIIRNYSQSEEKAILPLFLDGFIILALSSVAFTFYLRYVGSVRITFLVEFKIVLICFVPPAILHLYDSRKELKLQNDLLIAEKKKIQDQVTKYEDYYLNRSIEFISEYKTDILTLLIADIAIIKSADNYVEIVYKEGDSFRKSLIRNTLKNIELQLKGYPNFIRCHRICIVNKIYIEKLTRRFNSYWLTLKDFNEQIPVSRQYLLKLREAI